MNVRHELKVMWDMVKTAWSVVPQKCKYAVYGGLGVFLLMLLVGAASAENAPDSNFGFIGGSQDVVFACYVSDATKGAPPVGIVYTCLVLTNAGGMMVSDGGVAYCTREVTDTYACGTYEDMHKIASGI